ncbi:MAG: 23S rRNA (pseudouridine(1915)-N(3))-methyltransferase RlmH [Nitrincola lacisaponensis]|uniref:Ribosomal RNA large subunit methyltransferase H n=1 Tax=Nitrincola lacisaponensis TaxID=267850 RepID=A0A063Y238_9GAMM|nr:23S rRNA (pseudouridine(1915)-N(3))-methyltransferase RlmH [Nitrincola lacisaponensis]KDE40368.1 LSU m3Psi1915 methyltransferase RlmH [Nitrincola lacisaponensis]
MRVRILAVGQKMPAWVESGYQEYSKRLPADFQLELIELAPGYRGKGADIARAMRSEGDAMLAAIGKNERVIALDVKGKPWSTEQLASQAEDWRMAGANVCLLVGGPDGLDPRCLQRADQKWSLSALTLPHPLVRIVLAEQIYRAWTLLQGHPYHK